VSLRSHELSEVYHLLIAARLQRIRYRVECRIARLAGAGFGKTGLDGDGGDKVILVHAAIPFPDQKPAIESSCRLSSGTIGRKVPSGKQKRRNTAILIGIRVALIRQRPPCGRALLVL